MATELDQKALQAIRALQRPGKPDLLTKIVNLFEQESPKAVGSIREGVAVADLDQVRSAAHGLKSSSAYVGALSLSTRCRDLEHAARDGNFAACMVLSDPLEAELESTRQALRDYLDRAA